jgi:hypothetical protein
MKPNMVIFKHPHPDVDGNPQFVAFKIEPDDSIGGITGDGRVFGVSNGDPYEEMGFDHIVLAIATAYVSQDCERFKIPANVEDPGVTVNIYKLSREELNHTVKAVVDMFNLANPS